MEDRSSSTTTLLLSDPVQSLQTRKRVKISAITSSSAIKQQIYIPLSTALDPTSQTWTSSSSNPVSHKRPREEVKTGDTNPINNTVEVQDKSLHSKLQKKSEDSTLSQVHTMASAKILGNRSKSKLPTKICSRGKDCKTPAGTPIPFFWRRNDLGEFIQVNKRDICTDAIICSGCKNLTR